MSGGDAASAPPPGAAAGAAPGPLPTRELALECSRLIMRYHENGYRVVDGHILAKIREFILNCK